MRAFWPASEGSQADYELLRQAVLGGRPLASPAAARFESQGLYGLIGRPAQSEPVFAARLWATSRPAWTPYKDPRLDALADAYELIVSTTATTVEEETGT